VEQLPEVLGLVHRREATPFAVRLAIAGLRSLLRRAHRQRVVGMMLARLAETNAAVVDHRLLARGRARLDHQLDVCKIRPPDMRRHRWEAPLHHLGAKAQRLKALCPGGNW